MEYNTIHCSKCKTEKRNRILNGDVDPSLLETSDVIHPGILLAYVCSRWRARNWLVMIAERRTVILQKIICTDAGSQRYSYKHASLFENLLIVVVYYTLYRVKLCESSAQFSYKLS